MKIERIENSKHKQERVLVFCEGGDLLRITQTELLRFGLYAGQILDAPTEMELRKTAAASNARVLAAEIIGRRALSRQELIRKLTDKGTDEENAAAAADWLCDIGALDDAAYAAALVRRCAAGGGGRAKAREELYRRGVPKELWDDALAELPEPTDAIEAYVAAHLRTGEEKEVRRIAAALQRRGFRWDDIRSVLSRYRTMTEAED